MNKVVRNIRILLLKPRRFNPNNESKIQILLEAYQKYQIDIILLNETNTKQISVSLDKIEKVLKLLGGELIIIEADSLTSSSSAAKYLPGSLLLIIRIFAVQILY